MPGGGGLLLLHAVCGIHALDDPGERGSHRMYVVPGCWSSSPYTQSMLQTLQSAADTSMNNSSLCVV